MLPAARRALLLFLLFCTPRLALATALQPPRVEEPPRLDGILDEGVWDRAAVAQAFIQQRPHHGSSSPAPTLVRVLYTGQALYIGFVCTEPGEGGVLGRSLGRDADLYDDDYLAIVLDTFLDRQNGYFFQVNPLGARHDALFRNEGDQRNDDWDGVWRAVTRITPEGWEGEIEIPWRTLRFAPGAEIRMGVNFERQRRAVNEQSHWQEIPRQFSLFRVAEAGTLEGLRGIQPGQNLIVRPYALGRLSRGDTDDPGAYEREDWESEGEWGQDVKIGLTSNLTLDLTMNTDFAQVEVDDQQVNLTRFLLYFPEKREFFLEKRDFFDFGSPGNLLFFSRQVGLDENGETIPIEKGVRLTGKIGRTDVGALDIETNRVGDTPARRFDVLRLSRDVGQRSRVGAILVRRNDRRDDGSDLPGEPSNSSYGLDADVRPLDPLNVALYGALVSEDGLGDDNLTWGTRWRWTERLWSLTALHETMGTDYRPAVGFVPRADSDLSAVGWEIHPEPNWPLIRRFDNHGQFYWITRRHGMQETRYVHVHPVAVGHGNEELGVFLDLNRERLFEQFPVGEVVFAPGEYDFTQWGVNASSDASRAVSAEMWWQWGEFFDGRMNSLQLTVSTRWAPHLSAALELERNRVWRGEGPRKEDFVGDVVRLRLALDLTNQLGIDVFTQWNRDERLLLSQLRAHYLFGDESDLYFVINDARDDDHGEYMIRRGELTLKLAYALQF